MDNINWMELIPIIIPSVTTFLFAVLAWVFKKRTDSLTGLCKEVSEFVLKIVDASKDKKFTQSEMNDIIKEAQDVIEEARKLMAKG